MYDPYDFIFGYEFVFGMLYEVSIVGLVPAALCYALIGGGLIWLLLRWFGRPGDIRHVTTGAASWLLAVVVGVGVAKLASSFISNSPGNFVVAVSLGGATLGLVGGVAMALTLRGLGVKVSDRVLIRTTGIWTASFGVGTGLLLMLQTPVTAADLPGVFRASLLVVGLLRALLFTLAGSLGWVSLVFGVASENVGQRASLASIRRS